jgi:hypothetical protein
VLGEQRYITDGRIIPAGLRDKRKAPKKVDYSAASLPNWTRCRPRSTL